MTIWEEELHELNLPEAEKIQITERIKHFLEITKWFKQERWKLPPAVAVLFISESTEIIQSLGYRINLDPGEMPS